MRKGSSASSALATYSPSLTLTLDILTKQVPCCRAELTLGPGVGCVVSRGRPPKPRSGGSRCCGAGPSKRLSKELSAPRDAGCREAAKAKGALHGFLPRPSRVCNLKSVCGGGGALAITLDGGAWIWRVSEHSDTPLFKRPVFSGVCK